MRLRKMLVGIAAGFLAAGASAQSLKLINVNYPGIYCHFDPNCNVTPNVQSDSCTPSNMPVTCVLESRTFSGNSQDSQGQYGYEYRLTLNNNGAIGTNILTIDSLTLLTSQPETFAFGMHASNDVWVVTTGGPEGVAPSSADLNGLNVTIHFSPPLTLQTLTDQTASTCYFGIVSGAAPETTQAILEGSTQDPVYGTRSFGARLNAQTP